MVLTNLQKGQTLKIDKSFHAGRTYVVTGFGANKFGVRYAVCEWVEERGLKSSHFIFAADLS